MNKNKFLNLSNEVTQEIKEASGSPKTKNKLNVIKNIRIAMDNSIKKKKQPPIFNNLMPILCSLEILQLAYSNIKSNHGSMTPGTQGQTADDISYERLEQLSVNLKNGTYKFPNVRRTWIPKPGKNRNWKDKKNLVEFGRPVGMPDFDAKVVQEAARIILNAIYEPLFENLNVSFGFRPNKGCQEAIYQIQPKTQGMTTAIEGDIKGAFNNLNHEILIKILERRIQDKKFLNIIYSMCKAGIFDQIQNIQVDSLLEIPQGAIVSPMLWNIYMHEFDRYVLTDIQDLIDTLNRKQRRSKTRNASSQYRGCMAKVTRSKHEYNMLTKYSNTPLNKLSKENREKALFHRKMFKSYKQISLKIPSKRADRTPLRIYYTRYADDWIIFTNAKLAVAKLIKNKCKTFLIDYLNLTLSIEKTMITQLILKSANFLGFSLKARDPDSKKIAYTRKGTAKRVTGQKLYIGVDKERLISRLAWKGYHKDLTPRERPELTVLTDYEIISQYNAVIRGLVNYYSPVISYRSTLNHYIYILEYSCYKTLCQKHRTTIRKLLKKYDFPLKVKILNKYDNEKSVELLTCKTYWENLKTTSQQIRSNIHNKLGDQSILATSDFFNNAKSYWRTSFKLQGRCVVCGTKEHIQMHHIKHGRKIGKNSTGFPRIMNLLNRKQIPVCRFHHKLIHDGNYDHIALSDLFDIRIAKIENYLKLY